MSPAGMTAWQVAHHGEPADVLRLVDQAYDELCTLVAQGRIDPLVSERVPFADVPDVLTRLSSGRSTGRVVVDVQDA